MQTSAQWLLGLCAGLVSVAAHAIPITATPESAPSTITQTSQTISFSLDLSGLNFDANTYSVDTSNLLLNFGFGDRGNPGNSTVTLQFGSDTDRIERTAATLNKASIRINPEWFDFTTRALSFGILRNNSSGTLSLNSVSFSLALAAEPVDRGNGNGSEHSVPEPGTLALLGLGLFGMAMLGRRPRANATAA